MQQNTNHPTGEFVSPMKLALRLALRFIIYTVVIFGLAFALAKAIENGGGHELFAENATLEWAQFGMLFVSALGVLVVGLKIPVFREALVVLACWLGFAAIRELDMILDQVVPVVGWKFAMALPVIGLVIVLARWKTYWQQATRFLMMPTFYVFWAGFIVAVPIAQLIGHGPSLEALMGEAYNFQFKRAIEESGELLGYLIICLASVECMIDVIAQHVRDKRHGGLVRGWGGTMVKPAPGLVGQGIPQAT